MKAIEDIDVGQLRDALARALDFVRDKYELTPNQIANRPKGAIAFAVAFIVNTDDIDFPAGDRRLYDRMQGEFPAAFTEWADRQ
jgi:hypothetical protein